MSYVSSSCKPGEDGQVICVEEGQVSVSYDKLLPVFVIEVCMFVFKKKKRCAFGYSDCSWADRMEKQRGFT